MERLDFPVWKNKLHLEAIQTNRIRHVEFISDYVLQMFWERGCPPTIQALKDYAESEKAA